MRKTRECPCTQLIVLQKRNRVVAFVPEIVLGTKIRDGTDIVFCSSPPPRSRHGRARVVCACETGFTRIGASTVVLYGRNSAKLWEAFQEVTEPIVLVALHAGTRHKGGKLKAIVAACDKAGRECHVFRFDEPATVEIKPLDDARVRVV